MQKNLEMGLDTFGDVTEDAEGRPLSHPQVLRNVVDEAVLADQVGLDFFGVGEHHRADFAVSAPEVVMAAIAGQTNDSPRTEEHREGEECGSTCRSRGAPTSNTK